MENRNRYTYSSVRNYSDHHELTKTFVGKAYFFAGNLFDLQKSGTGEL